MGATGKREREREIAFGNKKENFPSLFQNYYDVKVTIP
jgi:hypothetical protein